MFNDLLVVADKKKQLDSPLPELLLPTSESAWHASQTFSSIYLPAAHWPCCKVNCRVHAVGFSLGHLSIPMLTKIKSVRIEC